MATKDKLEEHSANKSLIQQIYSEFTSIEDRAKEKIADMGIVKVSSL